MLIYNKTSLKIQSQHWRKSFTADVGSTIGKILRIYNENSIVRTKYLVNDRTNVNLDFDTPKR